MDKALISWSGGKDCAMALHETRKGGRLDVRALLTTVTVDFDRISMHGVRRELLERQADSLGVPLEKALISRTTTEAQYEETMRAVLTKQQEQGVSHVVIGDIFLEDLRRRREENLAKIGLKGAFPLWGRDTAELARAFNALGFKAVIVCVDSHSLDRSFAGRAFDERFLADLPDGVDPCGENGEFHSFVHDGPIFQNPIAHRLGEVVLREERFYFRDQLPA